MIQDKFRNNFLQSLKQADFAAGGLLLDYQSIKPMSEPMSEELLNDCQKPPAEALSVTEFTSRVKEHVESRFADAWVAGEISNLVKAASGHIYLTLKDDTALLRAVIWRGTRQSLAIEPADGLEVVCHGRLEVYPPRGTYQLTIDRLHAIGTGALEARLRQLHAALEQEGLFSPQRKRPIPTFPHRIALITSPTGAAIADFLETLFSRWRSTEVIVVPSRVQGAGAADELAWAITAAACIKPAVDVIAMVRGGGSLEDLWAFNEEVLVRAVAASPIPIVSGVGHEIDVSLTDLAADLRALTPTDAAVQVSPDGVQLSTLCDSLGQRLQMGLLRRIRTARDRISGLARSRTFTDPSQLVRDRRTLLEQHAARCNRLANAVIQRGRERLGSAVGRLEAGSPLQLLARGYSVTSLVKTSNGSGVHLPLRSTIGVDNGATLVTQLADGCLWSRVERTSSDALGE